MIKHLICIMLFFTSFSSLYGEIFEAKNFKEIANYIQPDTLVLLDIDDTLMIPVQTLGTDAWFMSLLNDHINRGMEYSLALDKSLAHWEAVRHITHMKIVEEGTDRIIHEMQKNHIVVMGLTTQGLALATRTVVQLNSLSMDLSKTAPSSKDNYFMNGKQGVLYRKGILFTAGTAKGEALVKFLDSINYRPKHIVFINDKKTHLQDVEKDVQLRNITFTGLRYSYSDERVAHFSKKIADIQWTHSTFDHVLSDEEASCF
jgi:orotate phosphoribosyltransferase